jgi:phospholipase C
MTTPADPALTCGLVMPDDPGVVDRARCAFGPGARASETLGVTSDVAAQIPIRHVIVLMKENRSFDHLLGNLSSDGVTGVEPVPPSFINRDLAGDIVERSRATTTCLGADPDHQWDATHQAIAHGAMTGFVESAELSTATHGHFVMRGYDHETLPFYYWLAGEFALDDRHFAPMASGTYANRNFLLFGTNATIVDSNLSFPDPTTPSIFRSLMDAGFTWASYTDGNPFSGALDWDHSEPGVHPFADFLDALDRGTLPNVSFVDGVDNVEDDHPTADLQVGEAWVHTIFEHAIKSPEWSRLAIVWTYDEAGGFADHVPPPEGCVARPEDASFYERGPRVPFVVISPWAKRHYVSHTVEDHTAITRFIETVFGLPALTARDANSSALLDMFDFSCNRDMSPPVAPVAGTGGCK